MTDIATDEDVTSRENLAVTAAVVSTELPSVVGATPVTASGVVSVWPNTAST
jgi:hypothetical protein